MASPSGPHDRRGHGLRRYRWLAAAEVSVLGFLAWAVLRLLRVTVRLETHGTEELERCWRERRPVLIAFWHGRAIMLPFFYRGHSAYIMNSTHRDGEIITRALNRFGIRTTRGSSSRGAVAGTLGLLRAFRAGSDLALIPDGPRGPAGVAKAGVAAIALQTGAPLFPVSVSCSRALRMTSWDRMMIPLPGARVVVVVGEVIEPARLAGPGAARDARERLRAILEDRLEQVTRDADGLAGREREQV